MNGRLQLLKSDIQVEMEAIQRIFEALPAGTVELTDVTEAIVVGYYLHNLYNAFESTCRLIADAFENHVPDTSRWHSLLLDRMGRDIERIRPRVLGDVAVKALDELRRFRYFFRHLYRYDLEVEGVQKALGQAQRLKGMYRADLDRFISFLDRLMDKELARRICCKPAATPV